jgi:hypothetical protein
MADGDVHGVLAALDEEIDRARETGSRDGYFACLYRKVTEKVAEGIATGFFDDGERMDRLDVAFAQRYLDARAALRAGREPTRSWDVAFSAARRWRPVIVQHLLVAVNAHINLDLGIAAATVCPGEALPPLRRDFDRINEILGSLVVEVMRDLGAVSPWIGMIDTLGGRSDDEVLRFSIAVARTEAWRFATELAPLPADQHAGPIQARDASVARLARRVLAPGLPIEAGLLAVRLRETAGVREVIDVLRGVPGPDLATVERRVRSERAPSR